MTWKEEKKELKKFSRSVGKVLCVLVFLGSLLGGFFIWPLWIVALLALIIGLGIDRAERREKDFERLERIIKERR